MKTVAISSWLAFVSLWFIDPYVWSYSGRFIQVEPDGWGLWWLFNDIALGVATLFVFVMAMGATRMWIEKYDKGREPQA